MSLLDGLYRYAGTVLTWDAGGLSLSTGPSDVVQVPWSQVHGARHIRVGQSHVELLVRGERDQDVAVLHVPVSSDADAQRLVTTIVWRVAERVDDTPRRRRSTRDGHR